MKSAPRHSRHPRSTPALRPGFMLIEATVAILLVAIIFVASLTIAAQSAKIRGGQQDAARGQLLARRLLCEIVQQAYEQPGVTTTTLGSEPGESRATFNDVDDYQALAETPPLDVGGSPIPGFSGWTRSTTVEWIAPAVGAAGFVTSPVETGLKRITVTVISPKGKTSTAVALRSKQSMYDKATGAQPAYTSWIGVTLQIGNDGNTTAAGGANPLNQAP